MRWAARWTTTPRAARWAAWTWRCCPPPRTTPGCTAARAPLRPTWRTRSRSSPCPPARWPWPARPTTRTRPCATRRTRCRCSSTPRSRPPSWPPASGSTTTTCAPRASTPPPCWTAWSTPPPRRPCCSASCRGTARGHRAAAERAWGHNRPMMQYLTVPVTGFQQNCSIVWCDQTRDAALIDPGGDLEHLKAEVARLGLTLKALWLTHAHIDHAGGTGQLARELAARWRHGADRPEHAERAPLPGPHARPRGVPQPRDPALLRR